LPGQESSFLDKVRYVAELLKNIPNNEEVLIISHLDADGISAGSIIFSTLIDLGLFPCIRIVKQLDENVIREISNLNKDYIFFVDMGSGQKSLINTINNKKIFIIDHHQPESNEIEGEINPHYFYFDGSVEISAAGIAYFLAKEIDKNNLRFSQLAIVGALGDVQDRGERGAFIGLNSKISQEAESKGLLKTKLGLRLYGSESRPLIQCLASTMDPYLPGLTGDEGACLKFIKSLGIEPRKIDGSWKTQSDLSSEELKTLISGLIKYLISIGLPSKEAEKIIGTIYIFPNELEDSPLRDAREFSSSINACGRMGKYGLGISICLGDRNQALVELKQIIQEYRKTISRYINWVLSNNESIKILSHVQAIYGGTVIDDKLIAPIISILSTTKPFSRDKPIIGFSTSSGFVKVSARAPLELVNKGINLGALIKDAAKKFGGIGGGHNIAAGAQIPIGKENDFLMYLNDMIKKELENIASKSGN